MRVEVEGTIFRWDARTEAWYFVALPEAVSEAIRDLPFASRGFGSVRVAARIGATGWRTSVFPDSRAGLYVLPLKRAVRVAEGLGTEGSVTVALEVLDA